MARIYSNEDRFFFDTQEEPPFEFELNENNLLGNKFRNIGHFLMERVAIEDPRDEEWWQWWRYDTDEEQFESMMSMVLEIGTLMIRDTATEQIEDLFFNRHHLEEGEIEEYLNGTE